MAAETGATGNDILTGTGANEKFVGDTGVDTVKFAGLHTAYTVTVGPDGTPQTITGPDSGTDTFVGIERLSFSDGTLAFDAIPKSLFRLYEASFNRAPDAAGIGWWVNALDNGGLNVEQVSADFLHSPEFTDTFGDPATLSNKTFIEILYGHILDRAPEDAGFAYWTKQLDDGMSREHVLLSFADSGENQANTHAALVGGVWLEPVATL
jgi:hypothetical protein